MLDYFIPCKIERGAFTTERTFHIPLSPNVVFEGDKEGELVGTAHLDHLRDAGKRPLAEDAPPYGEIVDGYVLGRKIRDMAAGMLVEVPSADVIHVSAEVLITTEAGGQAGVSF